MRRAGALFGLSLVTACVGSIAGFDGDDDDLAEADAAGPAADAAAADAAPLPSDCRMALDALGVTWTDAEAMPGVATPVRVTLPIGGIGFRPTSSMTPRTSFFMDCELALALAELAPLLAARGVVEVADYGVYNYRCIDQSVSPPDCPGSSLSMHAFAQAIDIAGVTTGDGSYYSVNDDWVIDPDAEPTCSAATDTPKDAFLHELICAVHQAGIFNIYLTPNYNSAHRNHFHVDLTDGSDFIRAFRPPAQPGSPDAHAHALEHP